MSKYGGTGGCGCGSGGGAGHGGCRGGCGCGCDPCSVCASEGYVRPRFFAGQLLTEDDLELLSGYVTAKNRLHNRFLIGDGVICGLEVVCHPCGDGTVLVRSGYALDCCGNDIVVPCEQTLDVNAMIRDLRVELRGGYDCGDPCAEPRTRTDEPAESDESESARPIAMMRREPHAEAAPVGGPRRYSLYIRYCEDHTDPVAPYATDEPCGPQGCEPSRVREGFSFELRCEAEPRTPDDMLARLWACVGDLVAMERWAKRTRMWYGLASPVPAALSAYRRVAAPAFEESDAQAMRSSADRLRSFVEAADQPETTRPDAETVRASLDDVRTVMMTAARLHTLSTEERNAVLGRFENVASELDAAPNVLSRAAERLEPHVGDAVDDAFERRAAHALLSDAPHFADPQLASEERASIHNYLAMHGLPLNRNVMQMFRRNLADVKEWLLIRIERATFLTDCRLRDDVLAIDVTDDDDFDERGVSRTSDAARALAAALIRYMASCVCAAMLPPCPRCDDPAVLLATIEVDECDVTHICNMERSTPITGPAVSYWLPVERLGRLLDVVCCELPRWLPKYEPRPVVELERPRELTRPAAMTGIDTVLREAARPGRFYARAAPDLTAVASPVARIFDVAGVSPRTTSRVTDALANVTAIPELRTLPQRLLTREPVALDPDAVAEVLTTEKARAAVADAVRDPVREAAEEAAKSAADRIERVEGRLKDLTAMKRELTTLRKRSDQLTQRNADLERRNSALERRVAALGGEG